MRKLILYICMSLDGFIATENDDLTWLSIVEKEGEDYGYAKFTADIDTYIVGRKTYSKVMEMVGSFEHTKAYDCYVLTRQNLPDAGHVKFYNGDVDQLIEEIRQEEGKHIYCDGGGEVVKLLMDKDLIDEYIISVIPTILGAGKRLFVGGTNAQKIQLCSTQQFDTGLVQLHYKRDRN